MYREIVFLYSNIPVLIIIFWLTSYIYTNKLVFCNIVFVRQLHIPKQICIYYNFHKLILRIYNADLLNNNGIL